MLKVDNEMQICSKSWRMFDALDEFRKEGLFCDVVINCEDGGSFKCHRVVLAAVSPYFKAMFRVNMLERSQSGILIKGVDSKSFQSLVTYAYKGEVITNFDSIISLLSAANMLRFDDVEKSCIELLNKNLNVTNCIDICAIAEALNYEELFRVAEIFIIKNFRWLARHSKFSEMTSAQLESVISNDTLRIASESEVYQAVLTWVKYEPEARCKHLFGLMQHVRFTSMNRKYLVDVVMRETMIMDDYDCRMLLLTALDHYLLPERRFSLQTRFPMPRKSVGQTLIVVGGRGTF